MITAELYEVFDSIVSVMDQVFGLWRTASFTVVVGFSATVGYSWRCYRVQPQA
ncbi:MAG: hypothetical protein QMC74_19855 [Myxococcota bacterium]|jgi:hypothetical protein